MTKPNTTGSAKWPWCRFWLRARSLIAAIYILGYLVLMDTHRPTSVFPRGNDYYESSFRWAPKQHASKDERGPRTQIPEATIFNVFYPPIDSIYFGLFPRPSSERETLRSMGYYQ